MELLNLYAVDLFKWLPSYFAPNKDFQEKYIGIVYRFTVMHLPSSFKYKFLSAMLVRFAYLNSNFPPQVQSFVGSNWIG